MTIAVDWDAKHQFKQTKQSSLINYCTFDIFFHFALEHCDIEAQGHFFFSHFWDFFFFFFFVLMKFERKKCIFSIKMGKNVGRRGTMNVMVFITQEFLMLNFYRFPLRSLLFWLELSRLDTFRV